MYFFREVITRELLSTFLLSIKFVLLCVYMGVHELFAVFRDIYKNTVECVCV